MEGIFFCVLSMKKLCMYCHKVHESNYECEHKKKELERQMKSKQHKAEYVQVIKSTQWNKTSEQCKERDHYLCQVCLDLGRYTPYDSVHHIIKVMNNKSKAFDLNNLITLCREHHEKAEKGELETNYLKKLVKKSMKQYE